MSQRLREKGDAYSAVKQHREALLACTPPRLELKTIKPGEPLR
ncbi:MAG: hypothetical protein QXW23_06540 [Thermofilaceae archaeon]